MRVYVCPAIIRESTMKLFDKKQTLLKRKERYLKMVLKQQAFQFDKCKIFSMITHSIIVTKQKYFSSYE